MMKTKIRNLSYSLVLLAIGLVTLTNSCSDSAASPSYQQQAPPALPVLSVDLLPATTWQEYSASLEGKTKPYSLQCEIIARNLLLSVAISGKSKKYKV